MLWVRPGYALGMYWGWFGAGLGLVLGLFFPERPGEKPLAASCVQRYDDGTFIEF